LKIYANMNTSTSSNQGVGGMSLLEHAFTSTRTNKNFRLQEAGPVGRRLFLNTRVQVSSYGSASTAASTDPTIVVQGAFTGGGAQVSGGTTQRGALVQSDLDYIRGINTVRVGTQLQGLWFDTDANTNFLGTYTFADLAAFQANRPSLFSQNLGNPQLSYHYLEGGVYAQDDLRLRKSLTISVGVRYEVQDHSTDRGSVGPRAGITWAPFKSGHTTLRASAGTFYDWIPPSVFEQSLRFDGVRQAQVNIIDPTFPESASIGPSLLPTAVDLLGPNVQLSRSNRLSAAISQDLSKRINVGVVYAHIDAQNQLSGVNLNAPVNGVLPNPAFTTVIEAVPDAHTTSNSVQTNVNIALAESSPDLNKARFNWRRGGLSLYYRYAKAESDALGAFTPSPSGTLATEWGPSGNDIRHTINLNAYSTALKNLSMNVFLNASSGAPYTETNGQQNNSDFLFDLRPDGIGRNTLRMPWQWDLSASASYTFGFHKRATAGPGQVGITMVNGQFATQTIAAQPDRFHVSLGFYASNLTNHANLVGFSGDVTSQFFMRATGATNMRSVSFFANFRF
jgi:hypothetical protein